MNKENRNLVNLDDNELDNIVGGAFNQNIDRQIRLLPKFHRRFQRHEFTGTVFRKKTSVPCRQPESEVS